MCHGKAAPLKRMKAGDVLIYYSPQIIYGEKTPCQSFTAIGSVLDSPPYQVKISDGFEPFRIDVNYFDSHDATIKPLISDLEFITDKKNWGYNFRFGVLKIGQADCLHIARAMGVTQQLFL